MSQKCLILGASSEMGRALITKLDNHYDELICHYHRHHEALLDLQKTIKTPMTLIQADFSDDQSTASFINELKLHPEITHVVHCPSIPLDLKAFKKMEWASFDKLWKVSVRSAFEVSKAVLPAMVKAKKGKMVFVLSSVTSGQAPSFMSDYVTSKYALLGLVKALASEVASHQININAVSPSMVETQFLEKIPPLTIEISADKNPMKRNAKIEDIIPMICFLLSDEANFITGQNILITGGEQ